MSISSWQIIPIAIAISLTGFLLSPKGQTQPRVLAAQPSQAPANPPPEGDRTPDGNNTPGGDL